MIKNVRLAHAPISAFNRYVKTRGIWSVLAWVSLIIIFFWALAKALGINYRSNFYEMIPIFAAVIFMARFYHILKTMTDSTSH